MAKGRKTGGRKKGTPNKKTQAQMQAAAASGLLPLDYMLTVMRDDKQPLDVRLSAAKDAAPYVHAKLASIVHTPAPALPVSEHAAGYEAAKRIAFTLATALQEAGKLPGTPASAGDEQEGEGPTEEERKAIELLQRINYVFATNNTAAAEVHKQLPASVRAAFERPRDPVTIEAMRVDVKPEDVAPDRTLN